MISYSLIVIGILGGTLIPVYLALYSIPSLKRTPVRYIAAVGLGLALWFFYDTFGDAGQLGVNNSVASLADFGGWPHIALIVAFLLGITVLAIFDHFSIRRGSITSSPTYSKMLFLIPVAVALVMGLHGLAEGWNTGAEASATSSTALQDAFGGFLPLISYPIHKFLEASIVAVVYTCYVAPNGKFLKQVSWQIPLLGVLFGVPSVIGTALGYYLLFDTTYFYAFGVAAAFYAVLRLIEPINPEFNLGNKPPMYLGGKVFLAVGIGFFLLYGAALLH